MNLKLRSIYTTFVIIVLLGCFELSPNIQAVVPAPDGAYPGGNTAEGQAALLSLTTGGFNTAVGLFSLRSNTTGQLNTASGAGTLLANTADENTAIGAAALFSNTTGPKNTATGAFALFSNVGGNDNTANGFNALFNNTTGSGNVAVGFFAGAAQTTGNDNVYIGSVQGVAGESNACYIGGIVNTASPNGLPVLINGDNKLGTTTSSKRFKDEIKPMDKASEAIFALNPVSFHYKKEIDPAGKSQFGLVAEDVEKVNPDLVVRDKEGKPYSVRYDQVNAMLLNEFLKEHRAFVEEHHKVAEEQNEIDALKAELKEQRSLIKRVSDRLELNKSTLQAVANDR